MGIRAQIGGLARLRFRPSRGDIALILVSGLAGAFAGGWLDYNTFGDNDAVRALAVRLLAIIGAVVAGAVWSKSRGQRSKVVVLASSSFFVATLVGGWIAPTAHRAGWSAGSAQVELHGAISRTETIDVDCSSQLDGAFVDISAVGPALAPGAAADNLGFDLTIQAESRLAGGPLPASTGLSVQVWTGAPGSGRNFNFNPELGSSAISGEGTAEHGRLTFENLSASTKDGGPAQPSDLPTLSGMVTWTCQPATREPTPIAGSWFH